MPKSAILRLAIIKANQISDRTYGAFTLSDLRLAHEWAWNEVRTLRQDMPHLTDEEAAEILIQRLKDPKTDAKPHSATE